ncbi:MAG: UDP-N-acetylmuramoyl-tripeptide--D-alanyl-D-alanine ligase [Alphaproteobacteria bacterium]|nr:UDP-N-acetylmuramoyl-tripeptide--D-alanyl-D-alanine ligase [Alphaproteobacteria bacterium]
MSAALVEVPILWTSDDAAAATGGRIDGLPWDATGVALDSRNVMPGDLFVALKGDQTDGHAFLADAFKRGAVAAMVHEIPAARPSRPLLVVKDTMAGLMALAARARARSQARIVSVTGSVGKTGTKEALRLALSAHGSTYASPGNLNSSTGAPLSLARLPDDAAFAVLELGMNRAGEIGPNARVARAHGAIVTTVEAVHLQFFPSVEAIADAKAEVFEGLAPGAFAVINRDNPHFERLAAKARASGVARIIGFGTHTLAEARLIDVALNEAESTVVVEILGRRHVYRLPVPGRHWAMNTLAVLGAVAGLGLPLEPSFTALGRLNVLKGRGLRQTIRLVGGGSFELIDDSYNASPVSVAGALEILGRIPPMPGGRRIAILGDMRELGAAGPSLHAGLAPAVSANRIDQVFLVGPLMRHLAEALPPALIATRTETSTEMAPIAAAAIRAGDVVTVKGSLGTNMAPIVGALAARGRVAGGR